MTKDEQKQFDEYRSHSLMLGQISYEVEEFTIDDEMSTLDAVKWLKAEWLMLKGEAIKNELREKYVSK